MIDFFRRWLLAWRLARDKQYFADGWNWAAGELLRGKTVDMLRDEHAAFSYMDASAFDYGAKAAMDTWEARFDFPEYVVSLEGCAAHRH